MTEYKTLPELDLRPGDVVGSENNPGYEYVVTDDMMVGFGGAWVHINKSTQPLWHLIRRAAPAVDLTKLTTAFGLLDAETQRALRNWPHGLTMYMGQYGWCPRLLNEFDDTITYRARPAPVLTKPSIDWSDVTEGWNWLAVDANGRARVSADKPEFGAFLWSCGSNFSNARAFASYRPGTCDWRDSLICRPGFEGDE